jgi:hypothetical protein
MDGSQLNSAAEFPDTGKLHKIANVTGLTQWQGPAGKPKRRGGRIAKPGLSQTV